MRLCTKISPLWECVSPIIFDEKIIGYIVIGQIKTPENSNFSRIQYNLPLLLCEKLKKLFEQLPSIPMDKINSAIQILDACAGYEYLKNWIQSNENKIDILLDEYINRHLAEDLSVSILCSRFHLSHSEIYSIFKEYFSSTPAEYIKIRRLKNACDLLKETNMPVNKIAAKCGIPDYNYFSKLFKSSFGMSPREFRKCKIY